jgi:Protein of unknown function (DUF3631)
VALTREQAEEDYGVLLLCIVRDVFNAAGVEFMFSAALADALNELDDAPWSEWRGPNDTQAAHRQSQNELARLLKPFGIRPRPIWPPGSRHQRGKSRRGYRRDQFTSAWGAYCPATDTPSHDSKIKHLRSV